MCDVISRSDVCANLAWIRCALFFKAWLVDRVDTLSPASYVDRFFVPVIPLFPLSWVRAVAVANEYLGDAIVMIISRNSSASRHRLHLLT